MTGSPTTAESADKATSVFLANMSHELSTPLNAIIGFSQMLEVRMFGDLNATQAGQVGHMAQGGRYLLKLINEILDLSAIEAGNLDLEIGPVDLHVIATEVHDTTHALAGDKRLQLTMSVPSIRFTGVQANVGTGLGLALTRRQVELHGGHVGVSSAGLGAGSTFTVELPILFSPSSHSRTCTIRKLVSVVPAKPMHRPRGSILVVEDDQESQDILRDVLRLGRYEVHFAVTVDDALSHLRERPPLAVIVDSTLQGPRSGWDVLEATQATPHLRTIPVIILSVSDEQPLARSLGATEALIKPVDSAQLLSVVNKACRRYRTNRTVLIVNHDPQFVSYMTSILHERGWNMLSAECGTEAVGIASRRIPDVAIIDQTLPDLSGIALMEWFAGIPALALMPVLLTIDQSLDGAEIARIDHDRHGVAQKLQTEAMVTEIDRLCDRLLPLEPVVSAKEPA